MHFRRRQNLLFLQSEKQNPTKGVVLWRKNAIFALSGGEIPGVKKAFSALSLKAKSGKFSRRTEAR